MERKPIADGRRVLLALLLLASLSLLPRLLHIGHDSAALVESAGDIYADEGYKTYSARNLVLFGAYKWSPHDEYQGWYGRSALVTRLYVLAFRAAGVSLSTARYLSILFSTATVLLLFLSLLLLRRDFLPAALLASAFLALSFPYLMFSRNGGFLEIHANLFLALAWLGFLLMLKAGRAEGGRAAYGWAGLLLVLLGGALAVLSKITSLISILGLSFGFLLLLLDGRIADKKTLARAVSGLFVLMLAAHVVFSSVPALRESLYPDRPLARFMEMPAHLLYLKFIQLNPLVFLLGALAALHSVSRYLRPDRGRLTSSDSVFLLAACWFLVSFLLTSSFEAIPLRYYLPCYLPLYLLAAALLLSPEKAAMLSFSGRGPLGKVFYAALVFIVSTNLAMYLLDRAGLIEGRSYPGRLLQSLDGGDVRQLVLYLLPLLSGCALTLLHLLFIDRLLGLRVTLAAGRPLHRRFLPAQRRPLHGLAVPGGGDHPGGLRRMAGILKEEEILAGDWAPVLGMSGGFRTIYSDFYFDVNIESLGRIRPHYVSIKAEAEAAPRFSPESSAEEIARACEQFRQFDDRYPGVIRAENIVYQFGSGPYHTAVFRADWGSVARRP